MPGLQVLLAAFNLECNKCPALRNLFPITSAWMSQHSTRRIVKGLSRAPSYKLRAASFKLQAASDKPRAASIKRQAASNKLPDHGPFIKFQAPRSLALGKYERVVRMAHMPCHLVWTKSQLVTLRDFKFYCKESIIFVVTQSIWHTWNA